MKALAALVLGILSLTIVIADGQPSAELNNGAIRVRMYLPDARNGFYRGTRFDWSGVIYSLEYKGHNYYGPWFGKTRPDVHDFIYEGDDVVAGPCSATTGPAEEFGAIGFEDAKPGGTFVKIGVGALRKTGAPRYDPYTLYEIADGGKWNVQESAGAIDFSQELKDAGSGYGYLYRKSVRLTLGKPEMVLQHTLRNTGTRAIHTTMYNHNFLTLDGKAPGLGLTIQVPFPIETDRPLTGLAELRDIRIAYLATLKGQERVATQINGFGASPSDNHIRIEDARSGAGMTIQTDKPLVREALWSIRTVMAIEPFINVDVEPGKEFTWQTAYQYTTQEKNR